MPFFAFASLTPFALIACGAVLGGPWPWVALCAMTLFTALLDRIVGKAATPDDGREFPAADALCVALVAAQCGVLVVVLHALCGPASWSAKACLFAATALALGQIGNSNAHELIHRPSRALRRLGVFAYVTVLYGQHASSHVLVHHIRVATEGDPATARRGESFYRFLPRAWAGSFRLGWQAEGRRLAVAGRGPLSHPYAVYLGGAALMLGAAYGIGGLRGSSGIWRWPLPRRRSFSCPITSSTTG